MKQRPTICAYYFPNWHVDQRNEVIHGKGWTEWRVAEYATPRFPGHDQPKVPLWGYEDESDPVAMSKKIKVASDYGVDAFIFDWYYFFDGPYRERCLNEGFLQATNHNDIKFALMWANHNPIYAHPGSYRKPAEMLWSGDTDADTFRKCTDYCIEHYFKQPNYLRVNDGLYFSFFRPRHMIEQLGGIAVARELFDDFRARVERAGLGKLTIDGMAMDFGYDDFNLTNKTIKAVGFDSTSNYSWRHWGEEFPAVEYGEWAQRNHGDNRMLSQALKVPYNPVILSGWDSSPRTVQSDMYDKRDYPFGTVIVNNTPPLFEKALRSVADFMATPEATGELVHIGCWNEWTEGSYLEPDTKYGYGFLEAVRNVFGSRR